MNLRLSRCVVTSLLGTSLSACGGQASPSASASVEGAVVDGLGQPAPGVKVLLDDTLVISDEAGRFEVRGAAATYDLALSASPDRAFVYQGMTTRTPVVRLDGTYLSPSESTALVHLDVSGLAPMTWLSAAPRVSPGDPESTIESLDLSSWRIRWAGHDPIHVGLYAAAHEGVPYDHVAGSLGAFTAPPVTLQPNETASFTIGPASLVHENEAAVAALVHLPPSYGVSQAVLWEGAASDSEPSVGFDVLTQAMQLPFFVPAGGQRLGLTVEATSGDATTDAYVNLPAGGKTVVDVPVAPIRLSPQDGATDVGVGTELRWTRAPGAANFVIVYDGSGGSLPTIRIAAVGGVARIPDLAPIDVVLPPHSQVAWQPCSTTLAQSVDDFARSGATTSLATPNVSTRGGVGSFVTR